jgi:diguanylate cyclase (GGDEF)-like protein/putative nucleotidyltransferase with HDIG domain
MKEFTLKTKFYLYASWIAGVLLLGWNLPHIQMQDQLMLLGLSALGSLALIFKVDGSTNRSHYSFNFLIYGFTVILLGTPEAVFVILVSNIVEWIWHKTAWYIQAFNIACYIIAIQATGLAISWINPSGAVTSLAGVVAMVVGMAVFTLLNHLMVGMILWLARGENFQRSGIFELMPMMIDFTLLILGSSLVLVWQFNQYAIFPFVIPLYLIYSTLKVPMLERKADTDPKTGLFNHRYFEQHLENELSRANRFDRPLTIIMADLDLLRNINNTYGHLAGDEVLIGIAKTLKQNVREYDVVARFGGEEFAILLPETSVAFAYERAEMIRQIIEKSEFNVPTSMTPIKVTMSFGIAGRENFAQPAKEIIHNADTALYHSKLEGRNRSFVFANGDYERFTTVPHEQYSLPVAQAPVVQAVETTQNRAETYRAANAHYVPPAPASHAAPADEGSKAAASPLPASAKSNPVKPILSVNAFITLVLFVAAAFFAIVFRKPVHVDWLGMIAFALLVIVTEWFSVNIYLRDTSVSTSAAPILAGTLLFGPLGALILSLVFALTALLKFGSPFNRFVFNFSNQLIAGVLYTFPFVVWNVIFTETHPAIQAVVCTVAAFLVYVSTTSLVTVGMHLDTKVPLSQIWQEKFNWLAPYYISLGVVAYTLVFGYQTAGLMGLAAILVPLLLIRWGQKLYIDRTRDMVSELREKNLKLEKNSEEISHLNEGLLDTLAEVIDLRDPYVLGHSRQVTQYAVMIAKDLGLNEKQIELIHKASLLHDVGKLGIPETILLKPSRLTTAEYDMMKTHPSLGAEILQKSPSLAPLIPIVEHHHEHYDGGGYPGGLAGKEIPIEARIVAVADAIEAMASDRPYRNSLSLERIKAELIRYSGIQFDPQVVQVALKIIEPRGEQIVVNLGQLGKPSESLQLSVPEMAAD